MSDAPILHRDWLGWPGVIGLGPRRGYGQVGGLVVARPPNASSHRPPFNTREEQMRKLVLALAVLVVVAGVAEAQELTWRKDIQPIVQASCNACHGANAPVYEEWDLDRDKLTKQNLGPRMDTYALFMRHVVWPATGSMMRRLDDGKTAPDGKPGNMYGFLGGTDADRAKNLQTIKTGRRRRVESQPLDHARQRARDHEGATRQDQGQVLAGFFEARRHLCWQFMSHTGRGLGLPRVLHPLTAGGVRGRRHRRTGALIAAYRREGAWRSTSSARSRSAIPRRGRRTLRRWARRSARSMDG